MTTDPAYIAGRGFFPSQGIKPRARATGGTTSSNAGSPWFHIPVGGPAETDRLARTPAKAVRLLFLLSFLVVPADVLAQGRGDRIGGAPPASVCVQVDVAGARAGHLECAAARLREAARLAQTQARAAVETSAPEAGSPDAAVGVVSLSGARLRLGPALGHSVEPLRPPRLPSAPRPGGRP